MFGNFSLFEMLVVGALALIVIGPKDLPKMMRTLGKMMGQARGMARQFQDSMNDAAREADLTELNDARKMLTSKSPTNAITNALNETLDFDDEKSAKKAEKPKDPALTGADLKARAKASGFGDAFAGKKPASSDAPAEPAKASSPTKPSESVAAAKPATTKVADDTAADIKTG